MSKEKLIQHYRQKVDFLKIVSQMPSYVERNKVHTYDYGKMTKTMEDNTIIECSVLIEFDENRPSFGIYYGCKVQLNSNLNATTIDSQWESIIEQIKTDFGKHWNNSSKADSRILSCDHEDKAHYWPFWIRLNDDEDIFEAVRGVQIIIQSLLSQKFCSC